MHHKFDLDFQPNRKSKTRNPLPKAGKAHARGAHPRTHDRRRIDARSKSAVPVLVHHISATPDRNGRAAINLYILDKWVFLSNMY